jgi:DNA-binding SARP family transcriptional activator
MPSTGSGPGPSTKRNPSPTLDDWRGRGSRASTAAIANTAHHHRQSTASGSNGNGSHRGSVCPLRLALLGGFKAERVGDARPVSGWQRRSAKTLLKILATHPRHALHREEIVELVWPGVEVESAINSFGKALYAARRALEPDLRPRASSAYVRLTDSVVALATEHVVVDVDLFQQLADGALQGGDVAAYESALAAYGGELLPEDRYEDWCAERREFLARLHLRLLIGLADVLEQRRSLSASADRFREVLQHDPTREAVHRRLMVLYAQMGMRDQAVRQFRVCEAVLRRELDLAPESATTALFQDVLANRIPRQLPTPESEQLVVLQSRPQPNPGSPARTPFVGHEDVIRRLDAELAHADKGFGRFVLISGEPGVGKTRLASELADLAFRRGASVFWGASAGHVNRLAFGPFAVALENYVAGRPDGERNDLAQCYPALAHFVPSLGVHRRLAPLRDRPPDDRLDLISTVVRLLSDRTRTGPVVLVLDDLHDLHCSSLDLLEYLALLAAKRRWLIVGTFREEGLEVGSDLWRMVEAMTHEPVCLRVELAPLKRPECDQLVRTLLQRGGVAEAVLDHVCAWSHGNPRFVEELVRDMRERDEFVFTGGSWQTMPLDSGRVPASVRALVARQLAPVGDIVRRVLALVAASGAEPSLSDLRDAAAALQPPISDAALFDALDRALERRILVEHNGVYAFRHPLVGPALYEDLPKHRRDEIQAAVTHSRAEDRERAMEPWKRTGMDTSDPPPTNGAV